jgi:hypothetical protein
MPEGDEPLGRRACHFVPRVPLRVGALITSCVEPLMGRTGRYAVVGLRRAGAMACNVRGARISGQRVVGPVGYEGSSGCLLVGPTTPFITGSALLVPLLS